MSDPVAELARILPDGWLVGGTVRDRVLGRETADFDVATAGSAGDVARELGRAAGGFAFELSEAFGAWRIVAHDRTWQVDVLPLNGATIEEDLGRRDLTINAIAAPLGSVGYVDPFGGLDDLAARRLRSVSPVAFERDPAAHAAPGPPGLRAGLRRGDGHAGAGPGRGARADRRRARARVR